MKKLLVICDEEKIYAERLADYFYNRREFCYEIFIFSSISKMLEQLRESKVDILLIEQKMYSQLLNTDYSAIFSVNKIMILSESRMNSEYVAEECVYKYQSASSILNRLLAECLDYGMSGYGSDSTNDAELIGVYSPIKRTLKTTFSYTLAQILSEKDSVLFMNLEGCSGMCNLLPINARTNLADLLFDYSIYREEYPVRFHKFIQCVDGIGLIPPVETVSELQCIPTEDWVSMLRRIKRNDVYRKIILDVGDNVNGIIDILRMCDVIYMPCRDDYVSTAKITSFERALEKYDKSDVLKEKIIKLEFPFFEDIGEDLFSVKFSQLGGYVRNLVQGN